MELFDFISNEDFRASLENDYKELDSCLKAGAWKATHVLAGSIIEAVLIDYLVAGGHINHTAALKLDFGKALALCKDNKIISSKTNDLSSVIKEFRNLIHPGRSIRLNETLTNDSAQVAKSLVHIVLEEVAAQKRKNYGYTAEQIAAKIQRDSSSDAIIPYLLKETNPIEIERLLIKVLPQVYMSNFDEEYTPDYLRPSLIKCFWAAFNLANEELKTKVIKKYVTILKEESERIVFSYEKAFLRAKDLKYLSEKDISLVKEHLLSRFKEDSNGELLNTLSGIGTFLKSNEITDFVDPLVRLIIYHNDIDKKNEAKERLKSEYELASSEIDGKINARLDDWVIHFDKQSLSNFADNIKEIKSDIEFDPF